jgi:hypothetical protein
MSTSIQRESESIINKYFSAVGTVCDSMKKKETVKQKKESLCSSKKVLQKKTCRTLKEYDPII